MANFLNDNNGKQGDTLASLYQPFGNQASNFISQGWRPETNDNGTITYRSKYGHAFNNVVTPNGLGHIALIGHPNQKFDVVIRDKNNNVVHSIYKDISPSDVQKYTSNASSTVAQRNNSIVQGTNVDKPDAKGNYVVNK